MPSRRDGQMVPLDFDLAKAELAVEWLPSPEKEFRLARKRWTKFVRSSNLLTGAQRQVGLAIAELHINRMPGHRWFNWAWPSHQTLADETGLTRRTVLSAVKRLADLGLLKIAHGGGSKGRGGRTDRYTLRMAGLAYLGAQADQIRQGKDVKTLRTFQGRDIIENCESGEICARKVRNPRQEDVKELPPILLETIKDSLTSSSTSSAGEERKWLSNVSKKKPVDDVTSSDHSKLAVCVGNGDVANGWERLQHLSVGEVDGLALRLRKEPSNAEAIRLQVQALSLSRKDS
ncbi:helix-turn-helix domain-containing protein [Bradyrhizobium erythrophlei]|uniref:Helix-turn-helix domain-containing protein n=1 Tax=Bradyrhizobium erythrophlei TaxID=1437360 RepID=A0A1M5R7R0_9BRAD|nr:helix-turn-helix domain-containing protein [Bradyrhizobium erythrophlei]SHH22261.1 Helix-turn-helix domain-containing protein [Bradyrhizobium erythrophlei]